MIVPVTELRELVNLLRRSGDCFVDGSGGTSSVFSGHDNARSVNF